MQIAIKTLVHDFNNDLTIINGVVALIDRAIEKGGTVQEIGKIVNKLKEKIDDIKLDLQDIIVGEEEICLEKYLDDTKEKLQDDYGVQIKAKSNKSSFLLTTSKGQLNRLVRNIVKNAVEANATQIDFFMSHNYFLVRDNGRGIPLNVLKAINQNKVVSSKNHSSHGYGIMSIKEFCQKHNLDFQIANSHISAGAQITIRTNLLATRKVC